MNNGQQTDTLSIVLACDDYLYYYFFIRFLNFCFNIRRSSSLGEAANANLDEQAYPQCIGGVLSVMHDFNSVSGMWSDSQLKGRGG